MPRRVRPAVLETQEGLNVDDWGFRLVALPHPDAAAGRKTDAFCQVVQPNRRVWHVAAKCLHYPYVRPNVNHAHRWHVKCFHARRMWNWCADTVRIKQR